MKHYKEVIKELELFCEKSRQYSVVAELRGRGGELYRRLEALCAEGRKMMSIERTELLVALLDAYEVTRDEEMLQEVLDVVSGGLDRLEVSVEAVKLLAYCYYYVEEEECRQRAGKMLEELRRKGKNDKELVGVEHILEELV